MLELSRDDIRHLSQLARLELGEEEYARYAGQLTSVVGYIEQLKEVDVSSAGHPVGVSGLTNVLADDVKRPGDNPLAIDPQTIIQNAPQSQGRLFQVRAVLAGDEGSSS